MFFEIQDNAKKISETNFKNHYPYINSNVSWQPLSVAVNQAITLYILPFLGLNAINNLKNKFAENTLNDDEKQLIELLNNSISYYAVWMASPHLNLTISDMGIGQQSDTKGTTAPVDSWRYKHHHWMVMKKADQFLDQALDFINKNLTDLSSYQNQSKLFDNLLIETLSDFETFVNINRSFRTFIKIIPYLRKAEKKHLAPLLGRVFLAELKSKKKANNLSDIESELLKMAQSVIAESGLLLAVPRLSVLIDNGHIFMVSSMEGMNTKEVRHDSAIADLKEQLQDDLNLQLQELETFLFENADALPTFKNSDHYQLYIDETTPNELTLNSDFGGVFMPDCFS